MHGFKILPQGAYPFLLLDEKLLVKQCRMDTYTASGPGGQKRNRTYSAVRIIHQETGLSAIAEESRSQTQNKQKALQRLKKIIALHIRAGPERTLQELNQDGQQLFLQEASVKINTRNPRYPLYCAVILDVVYRQDGKISEAAKQLGISTGKLNKFLSRDKDLLVAANRLREYFNHKPLKL